jgi:hypothetical protein
MISNRENVLNEILKRNKIKDEIAKNKITEFFNKFAEIVEEIIQYGFNFDYTPKKKIYDLIVLFEDILKSSFKEKEKENILIAIYEINLYFKTLILAYMTKFKNTIEATRKESEINIKEDL